MNQKAQGALEYMLLIGGAVLVAAIVIVIVVASGTSAQCNPEKTVLKTQLTTTAVAYWDFDEGSGGTAKDKTVNGNNGTLEGTTPPVWSLDCKSGSCLDFSGDDYVEVQDNASLNFAGNFSIEAWINTTASTSQIIVGKAMWSEQVGEYAFYIHAVDGQLYTRLREDEPPNYWAIDKTGGGPAVRDGKWHHVVLTVDRANFVAKTYVDGSQTSGDIVIDSFMNASFSNTKNLTIGATGNFAEGDAARFNGFIDEVRLYNRALSAEEISGHYKKESCK